MRNPIRAYREALTAAAVVVQAPTPVNRPVQSDGVARPIHTRTYVEWQREAWDYYDSLGEFKQGITWKSNMMSRIILQAARVRPGQDPEPVLNGPAHDIVAELGASVGGHAEIMGGLSVYLGVPGECYLIGETIPNSQSDLFPAGKNKWYLRDIEEVRPTIGDPTLMEVKEGGFGNSFGGTWRALPRDSYVTRIYRPHRRWHGAADSASRGARNTLRELELVNRHIQAQYISRLASAGIVVFPDDIMLPVRPEFADQPDPFISEWIEIAAEAIKTPGSAVAAVPIPMRVPGEMIDKIKHLDFTLKLDEKIIDKRDSALVKLSIELDMPSEALLGGSHTNHWNLWLIDEQGVKIHVAPDAELMCNSLTNGYLHPRLEAAGEDPSQWCVWYDATALMLRPDQSANALQLYDRVELTAAAARRECGFDETDAPSDAEVREIILKKAALQPVNTYSAMDEMGLKTDHDTPPTEPRPPTEDAPAQDDPQDRTPPQDSGKNQGPSSGTASSAAEIEQALRDQLIAQAKLEHAVKIDMNGWSLLHPKECSDHLFSCPLTHATWKPVVSAMPGRSGVYRCFLNAYGQPILGEMIINGEVDEFIPTRPRPLVSPMKI